MHTTGGGARLALALLAATLGLPASASAAEAPTMLAQAEPTGVFHGVGIIKAIDPRSGALTLDHEEIKGLMPAMEMMYRVKSRGVSAGLRVGDRIAFSLDAKSYTILDARAVGPAR